MDILSKAKDIIVEYDNITEEMIHPDNVLNQEKMTALSKKRSSIEKSYELSKQFVVLNRELSDLDEISDEKEMEELIKIEKPILLKKITDIEAQLTKILITSDPNDNKNAIIEIRAGTGGDEAALFAADLFRMYSKYAEKNGMSIKVMDMNEIGGGRVHTSAATVAVLPEAEQAEVDINESDLKIDTYRASGAGGQHVNKTESAIRITHIPTGLVVTCQDESSQHKNKASALKVLRARLFALEQEKIDQDRDKMRKSLVSTGDRSAKIRTYNFPQGRITDHRINYTAHNLQDTLEGNLDHMVEKLKLEEDNSKLNQS